MSHQAEQQQLWIILLIVFIGFLGTSVAYPIFPPLFLHPEHGQIIPAEWSNNAKGILLGFALAAYPLGQFIGSPIIGGCSDRYGRKKILMLTLIVSACGYLLSAISLQFHWLWMLLLSRFITGVVEGNLGLVRAMAADLQGINKFKSLGRVNGVSAIGYVIGPLIGGFFSDSSIVPWFSFAFPFYLAMSFSVIALVLAAFKLIEKPRASSQTEITIWQRFNLIARFRYLFKTSPNLKFIIIISTIFTFAVDIFYEFGPVYLTGYWSMTPAGIAIYNAGLSFALSIGASWLPHYLSLYYSTSRIIIIGMTATSVLLGLMVIFPHKILVWFLFALVGFAIATVNTSMVVQISNVADHKIQGEAMGSQLGLRMLGDAIICSTFGFLIISSVLLPIAISCVIALLAVVLYIKYQVRH